MVVRGTAVRRALEIGTGSATGALAIAEGLPPDGMLISLERVPEVAKSARQVIAAAGEAGRVSVMIGDAARFLHKIAGPFDLVFVDGDPAQYEALHDRLVALLAPGATLITHNLAEAHGYNEVLTADVRLRTVMLKIGNGVAISVRMRRGETR
jgi:caffeoyl-CoA O-methyltransferase